MEAGDVVVLRPRPGELRHLDGGALRALALRLVGEAGCCCVRTLSVRRTHSCGIGDTPDPLTHAVSAESGAPKRPIRGSNVARR